MEKIPETYPKSISLSILKDCNPVFPKGYIILATMSGLY